MHFCMSEEGCRMDRPKCCLQEVNKNEKKNDFICPNNPSNDNTLKIIECIFVHKADVEWINQKTMKRIGSFDRQATSL